MMVIGNLSVSSSLLGAYLKSSGLTQAAFAELVDVSEAAVQHWLTGYAKPRDKVRKAIQSITGIDASGWDAVSETTDLESFIVRCEERERLRREQHHARMAAWRVLLEQRRAVSPPSSVAR